LSLVIYFGEKMIERFEFGVINWYDLRDRTLDKSRRAYKSVQKIGWKKSGKVRELCYRKSLATLEKYTSFESSPFLSPVYQLFCTAEILGRKSRVSYNSVQVR